VVSPQTPLRAVANSEVPMVPDNATLGEVLDAVASTRLNRTVVTDAANHPVGIISDDALLRRLDVGHRPAVVTALMAQLPFVHLPPEQREAVRLAEAQRASDLMTSDFAVADTDTSVAEAIRMMIARRQKILPIITSEGQLIGAVDRADLLRAVDAWLGAQQPPS